MTVFLLCCPRLCHPQNSRRSSTKADVFLSYNLCCSLRQQRTTALSFAEAAAVRLPSFLLCCPRQAARETAASFQPSRAFFSQTNLVVSGATAANYQSMGVATAGRVPVFLLCCPRQAARKTAVSLQPRRPFFFLSRKKEKVGGKKKENFAYGKSRNAVRRLRRGKRRFILPTMSDRFNPHCRCAALHDR